MGQYHPKFGELLSSREVSDMTGYTMNQLRYFRQDHTKAPFPMVKKGNTTLYRLTDIEKYIAEYGTEGEEYLVPDAFEPTPLINTGYETGKRKTYAELAKITTRNSWSKWQEQLTLNSGLDANESHQFLDDEQVRFHEMTTGEDLRKIFPDAIEFNMMRKRDPHRFWPSRTYAIRSLARKVYEWEITDEDIINTPIGDVPPTKID